MTFHLISVAPKNGLGRFFLCIASWFFLRAGDDFQHIEIVYTSYTHNFLRGTTSMSTHPLQWDQHVPAPTLLPTLRFIPFLQYRLPCSRVVINCSHIADGAPLTSPLGTAISYLSSSFPGIGARVWCAKKLHSHTCCACSGTA